MSYFPVDIGYLSCSSSDFFSKKNAIYLVKGRLILHVVYQAHVEGIVDCHFVITNTYVCVKKGYSIFCEPKATLNLFGKG